jgi:ATP-dependent protease ClpP protease subunit
VAKEILLYTGINNWSAEDFINQLEACKGVDISVRMNCPGGDVYAAYGMIAKFAEHKKGKQVKVDGMAKSGGFYFCCYAEDVTCLDVTDFMAHRAYYPSWIENDKEAFTDEIKAQLVKINNSLRAGIEAKIGAEKFKKVTGVSLDDMFSLDSRIDVNISAQQAKEMGLVSKIIPLTSDMKKEIDTLAYSHGIAAFSDTSKIKIENTNSNIKVMTAAEFKAANPEAYNAIVAEGVAAEKIRVKAWMAFNAIDPKGAEAGVLGDAPVTMDVIATMSIKAASNKALDNLQSDSAPAVTTPEVAATKPAEAAPKEARMNALLAEARKEMGLPTA